MAKPFCGIGGVEVEKEAREHLWLHPLETAVKLNQHPEASLGGKGLSDRPSRMVRGEELFRERNQVCVDIKGNFRWRR